MLTHSFDHRIFGLIPCLCCSARCTSAAPSYFPICTAPNGMTYQDGALKANCPVRVACGERSLIWPELDGFDELISIGSGFTESVDHQTGTQSQHILWRFQKAIARNLNAQAQWDEALHELGINTRKAHRLSIKLPEKVKLNDAAKIDELNSRTNTDYGTGSDQQKLADTAKCITASLFYFELTSNKSFNNYNGTQNFCITGTIRCRLHYLEKEARKRLAEKLAKRRAKFTVDGGVNVSIKPVEISAHDELVYELEFRVPHLETEISINLGLEEKTFPISGMPRKVKVSNFFLYY